MPACRFGPFLTVPLGFDRFKTLTYDVSAISEVIHAAIVGWE
jgi:hypothetical protein